MNLKFHRGELTIFLTLLAIGLFVRLLVIQRYQADLKSDPDIYVALADGLVAGNGYSIPGTTTPTAFRPPLYPLLLTATRCPLPWISDQESSQTARLIILQIAMSIATIPLVWWTAWNLGLSMKARLLAAVLVTFDPLSLRYLSSPMTEVLCAFLMALLLFQFSRVQVWNARQSLLTGLLFGICVLARPTFWAMGILLVCGLLILQFFTRKNEPDHTNFFRFSHVIAGALGIAICTMPWLIRNIAVMKSPILMTSHGGYTLLLGNNPAFYREVVLQPWGTVWDGSKGPGQEVWYAGVKSQMLAAKITGEVEADRYQNQFAKQAIIAQPATFVRACWLKFLWFWNVAPHATPEHQLPNSIWWVVASYYLTLWLLLVTGISKILTTALKNRRTFSSWLPALSLIGAMTITHLFYWSDARMRAPLLPAISLIAALAIPQKSKNGSHFEYIPSITTDSP